MLKLERECIIGLDVSTTCVGLSLMDLNGKLIDIDYILFPKSSKKLGKVTIYKKAELFFEFIQKYKDYKIKHIFIEEPLKNGPNINTTILLAKFNGIVSQKMFELFSVEPEHISVYDARFIFFPEYVKTDVKKKKDVLSFPKDVDKKKLVHDKVSWMEPQIIWQRDKYYTLIDPNFDMADSYCVSKSGLYLHNYIKEIPIFKL